MPHWQSTAHPSLSPSREPGETLQGMSVAHASPCTIKTMDLWLLMQLVWASGSGLNSQKGWRCCTYTGEKGDASVVGKLSWQPVDCPKGLQLLQRKHGRKDGTSLQ